MKINTKLVVTTSNLIVNAAYKLTLNEQRVLLLILAKIESKDTNYGPKTEFIVTAKEFSETFGIPLKSAYTPLQEAGDHLLERKITLPIKHRSHYVKSQWVSDVEYINLGSGASTSSIKINIAPRMLPLLTQLKSNFTTYQLAHTARFKSAYSHRIYQMLVQWKSTGRLKIDLAQLRNRLMLPPLYDQYKFLKSRILTPCLKEINKHSDLKVELKEIKSGRQVTDIVFQFTVKKALHSDVVIKFSNPTSHTRPSAQNDSVTDSETNRTLKHLSDGLKDFIQ